MFRIKLTILIMFGAVLLYANPEFYPRTQLGEAFLNSSNPICNDAIAGLNVIENQFSYPEIFNIRYYSQSAGLSNIYSEARVAYYNIITFPTMIFNGTQEIVGGGASIVNGSDYVSAISQNRFAPSPIKMQIVDYNSFYGTMSVSVTMMSPTFSLQNQSIRFVLVQKGLPNDPTNIVRELITQPISLTGLNNSANFTVDFTTEYYGVVPEFWVASFVQLDNGSVIQAVSILPQSLYQVRAAFDWSPQIIGPANANYLSDPVWFFNTGLSENFTIRIVKDEGPADWYFNFCDENGMCYPGNMAHAFSLPSGAYTGYHLNLITGSSGTAHFRFIIESDNIPDYEIPFSYQTDDTASQDEVIPNSRLALLGAYPNPVYGSAAFKVFSPASASSKQIDIYNIRGQKVQSISTGELKTGTNEIAFRAAGFSGKPLAGGIYYCRLQGQTAARKILILNK